MLTYILAVSLKFNFFIFLFIFQYKRGTKRPKSDEWFGVFAELY